MCRKDFQSLRTSVTKPITEILYVSTSIHQIIMLLLEDELCDQIINTILKYEQKDKVKQIS